MVNVPAVHVLFKILCRNIFEKKVEIFFCICVWVEGMGCVCVEGGNKLGGLRGGALHFLLDEALKCGCVCDPRNEKISIETTIILCLCVCA